MSTELDNFKIIWTFLGINEKIDYEGDELVNFIKREDTESIDLRSVLAQSAANVLLQVKKRFSK